MRADGSAAAGISWQTCGNGADGVNRLPYRCGIGLKNKFLKFYRF